MSTPVASASMSVPSAVGSNAAKPAGSESIDTVFDALFAAIESLTSDRADSAEGAPASNPTSEPQSDEPVSVNPSSRPGLWIAQIDPTGEKEQNLEGAAQPLSTLQPREANTPVQASAPTKTGDDKAPVKAGLDKWPVEAGEGQVPAKANSEKAPGQAGSDKTPVEVAEAAPVEAGEDQPPVKSSEDNASIKSDRNTVQVRNSHIAKTQAITPSSWVGDKEASAKNENNGAAQIEKSSSRPTPSKTVRNSEAPVVSQIFAEVLSDKQTEPATTTQPQLENGAPNTPDQAAVARAARPKESVQADDQTSKKRDESDVSETPSDRPAFTEVAQQDLVAKLPALPSDTGRFPSNHVKTDGTDDTSAGVDAAPSDRSAQTPARTESPRIISPHINTPAAPPDNNFNVGEANATPSVAPQGKDGTTEAKTSSSNRTTAPSSAPDNPSTPRIQSDDTARPQLAGQAAPSYHADAGMPFTPASDPAPQNALANSDAPVRLSFAASPNSLEQPAFDALALRIAAKSSDGDRNFSIRLDPPELGRVEVSLNVNASGHAQAEISADKPQTLELLQRDAPVLERALKDAGLNLAGGFAFSLKGEGKSGGSWRDTQHGGRGRNVQVAGIDAATASASLTGTAAMAARAYGMPVSRVDIRV